MQISLLGLLDEGPHEIRLGGVDPPTANAVRGYALARRRVNPLCLNSVF